jgi:hypothetical protein
MSETVALVFGMTDPAAAGVMGTDVVGFRSGRASVPVTVVGFRSGRGRVSATVVGFRSGTGSVPVTIGASAVGAADREAVGVAGTAATGAAGRCGLRSGKVGGSTGGAEGAWRDFATAIGGARHARSTSNGKACARMRFISSIGTGYDPASSSQDVPRAGEPRR